MSNESATYTLNVKSAAAILNSSGTIRSPAQYSVVIAALHGGLSDEVKLLKAAPDLLEALNGLVGDISDRFDLDSPRINRGIKHHIEQSRAAIAKATGQ